VTDAASLAQAVAHDYVCAEYKNSYRSNANFIRSNCLAVEFDNDHSENPDEWVTPEDLRATFPDVTIGIHYSRHHLKEKNGKPARPKFHAFLEIDEITDHKAYSAMKKQVAAQFPYVDPNALDAARFFFGTKDPQTDFIRGTKTLNEFFAEEGEVTVSAPYESFGAIQKWIEDNGHELVSGEGVRIPTDTKELTAEQRADVEKLQEKLEEDDDVVNVYHTMAESDDEE
jgi:hypothetical protein